MFIDALKYPLRSENTLITLTIGSLLLLASIFILPVFILVGFLTRTVKNTSCGNKVTRFRDYKSLFVRGLKFSGVIITYLLFFVFLMFLMALSAEVHRIAGLMIFWILIVPAYFGLMYLSPSILYHFSKKGMIKDAFQIKKILRTAYSLKYLKIAVLVLIVIPLLFGVLQASLAVTIIGWILVPAIIIYELIVYGRLVGQM
ncbi:putative membrane protein DUF4013 family [Methanonatronarchaeum thermophilum]|uniref:Putative membrane protein DUF4013 family n=1 Tax=Methanonatronarchaeum thermophilum TaxID=1927129 RepID=A0A1Y3GIT2_9EURY|nr:DUF4013 domain-containing protein [Methanonatronarchaeum thermophilum]OUJ19345.1 putative membrane protein DUF4013 family [Methanonatronarchaeum thermophilum]